MSPGLSLESELSAGARHALAGEIVVRALEPHILRAHVTSQRLVEATLSVALASARAPLIEGAARSLDAHFIRVRDSVSGLVEQLSAVSPGDRDAVLRFSEALSEETAHIGCATCLESESSLCNRASLSESSDVPACLREVFALFELAAVSADALYRRGVVPPKEVPRIGLKVCGRAEGSREQVEAWCDVRPLTLGVDSQVRLEFAVGRVTVPTMRELLYVLMHELVCHAYQRLGAHLREVPRKDSFSEGWMDWIACQMFLDAVHRKGSAVMAVRHAWIADAAPGLVRYGDRANEPHVRQGREAAQRVHAVMVAKEPGPAAGVAKFEVLSCLLNVNSIDLDVRRDLTIRLSTRLPPAGSSPRPQHRPAIECVVKYMADNDLGAFVRRVLALT